MSKICYEHKNFNGETLLIIDKANEIITYYNTLHINLTLRQLYYQFIRQEKDLLFDFPNTKKTYTKLVSIVKNARLAGCIDWKAIVDLEREYNSVSSWTDIEEILLSSPEAYKIDKWHFHSVVPEIWIEKKALLSVINGVCLNEEVSYFACKGYPSVTTLWEAGQRIATRLAENTQFTHIIYLGDHDPSGLDVDRNIADRLTQFAGHKVILQRVALTIDQVRAHKCPPNWAKKKDKRYKTYYEKYGPECWELDALDPTTIQEIISNIICEMRDDDLWQKAIDRECEEREKIEDTSIQAINYHRQKYGLPDD